MVEYGAAVVSLSQDRNFSTPTSDEEEDVSHQSPHPRSSYNFKVVKVEPVRHRSVEHEPLTNANTSSNNNNNSNSDHEKTMSTTTMMGSRKKPRGRPPGSKNKPRAPVVFRHECHSAMKTVVIEISAGADVIDTLVNFARRRRVGISVLSGCGSVSNVTLRRPLVLSHSHAPPSHKNMMTLHGPFNLLSLSGSVVESLGCSSSSFGVCLAGTQGQMFGGIVGGGVIAASLVVVVAATFLKPRFHKLPAGPSSEDDEEEEDIMPCLLSNIAEETTTTTSFGFGGDGSGSVAAMPTGGHGGVMSTPQPVLQPVSSTWGGHPPLLPPY